MVDSDKGCKKALKKCKSDFANTAHVAVVPARSDARIVLLLLTPPITKQLWKS